MNRPVRSRVRYRAGALLLAGLSAGCGAATAPVDAPRPLRILTGREGGGYYPLGLALADHFNRTLPVDAAAEKTSGSVSNIRAVEDGTADLGFAQSDVVYAAFQRGTEKSPAPHTHLRSVAMLYANAVHVVARRDTSIRTIGDLRGTRVAFGSDPTGGGASRMIIETHGLDYETLAPQYLPYEAITQKLAAGELDAAFFASGVPTAAVAT